MESVLYLAVRDLHNITRWLILLTAAIALFVNYRGWLTGAEWRDEDRRAGRWFVLCLHLQLCLGLALYVLSPLVGTAWQDLALAMSDRTQRFFSTEHPVQMLTAIVIATIGHARARRAPTSRARFRRAALSYSVSLLLILAAVPWPFSSHSRTWGPRLEWMRGGPR